jgi:putative transposase
LREGPDDEAIEAYGRADQAILKEQEAGAKTADVCRKHGILKRNVLSLESQVRGLSVSEAKRLRALKSENARLKKLFADAVLDNAMLKDLLSKKW